MNYLNAGKIACGIILSFITLACAAAPDQYLSPSAIVPAPNKPILYIALHTSRQVAVFDTNQKKIIKTIQLTEPISALTLTPDSKTLFVAEASTQGSIAVIDTQTLKVTRRFPAGHFPSALALDPTGQTLYICRRYQNTVLAMSTATGKIIKSTPTPRQPCALAATADGKYLLVNNFLPAGPANGDYAAGIVSILDAANLKPIKQIQLPNGSQSLTDIALSPDGKFAYVTHLISRYQLPTTQLDRGWMNTNALSVIDLSTLKLVNSILLDDVDLGAANPWGVAVTPDNKTIVVTISGTHQLCLIDRTAMHDRLEKAARGEKVTAVTHSADYVMNDLSFLVDIKKNVALKGKAPRGLAIVNNTIYIAEYFSDSLGILTLGQNRLQPLSIALGSQTKLTPERQGELFFHDASLCFQKWQSCASCHPDSARVDGLNWDLLNDGLGNPKNTRSMLLAHQTPPVMSLGVRADAETAVRAGIRHIQFAVRPDADAQAIDAYLKSLKPMPSPKLINGKLSPAAQRGKEIFKTANCAHCHSGPYFTNLKTYNVGTGRYREKDAAFDTPTLIELWRTAPYLHDGRAASLHDVFSKFNPNDKHGKTSNLSKEEMNDLMEYLLSL